MIRLFKNDPQKVLFKKWFSAGNRLLLYTTTAPYLRPNREKGKTPQPCSAVAPSLPLGQLNNNHNHTLSMSRRYASSNRNNTNNAAYIYPQTHLQTLAAQTGQPDIVFLDGDVEKKEERIFNVFSVDLRKKVKGKTINLKRTVESIAAAHMKEKLKQTDNNKNEKNLPLFIVVRSKMAPEVAKEKQKELYAYLRQKIPSLERYPQEVYVGLLHRGNSKRLGHYIRTSNARYDTENNNNNENENNNKEEEVDEENDIDTINTEEATEVLENEQHNDHEKNNETTRQTEPEKIESTPPITENTNNNKKEDVIFGEEDLEAESGGLTTDTPNKEKNETSVSDEEIRALLNEEDDDVPPSTTGKEPTKPTTPVVNETVNQNNNNNNNNKPEPKVVKKSAATIKKEEEERLKSLLKERESIEQIILEEEAKKMETERLKQQKEAEEAQKRQMEEENKKLLSEQEKLLQQKEKLKEFITLKKEEEASSPDKQERVKELEKEVGSLLETVLNKEINEADKNKEEKEKEKKAEPKKSSVKVFTSFSFVPVVDVQATEEPSQSAVARVRFTPAEEDALFLDDETDVTTKPETETPVIKVNDEDSTNNNSNEDNNNNNDNNSNNNNDNMEEKQEVEEEKKVIEAILDEIRGETPEKEKEKDVENEKLKKEEEMKNGAFGIFSAFSFAPVDEVSRGAVYKPTITLKEEKKEAHEKKKKNKTMLDSFYSAFRGNNEENANTNKNNHHPHKVSANHPIHAVKSSPPTQKPVTVFRSPEKERYTYYVHQNITAISDISKLYFPFSTANVFVIDKRDSWTDEHIKTNPSGKKLYNSDSFFNEEDYEENKYADNIVLKDYYDETQRDPVYGPTLLLPEAYPLAHHHNNNNNNETTKKLPTMFVFLTRIQSNLIKTYHFLDAKLSTERRAVVVLGTTFAQQVETIRKENACAEKEAIESLLALSGGEESGTTVDHHNNENENNNNNKVEAVSLSTPKETVSPVVEPKKEETEKSSLKIPRIYEKEVKVTPNNNNNNNNNNINVDITPDNNIKDTAEVKPVKEKTEENKPTPSAPPAEIINNNNKHENKNPFHMIASLLGLPLPSLPHNNNNNNRILLPAPTPQAILNNNHNNMETTNEFEREVQLASLVLSQRVEQFARDGPQSRIFYKMCKSNFFDKTKLQNENGVIKAPFPILDEQRKKESYVLFAENFERQQKEKEMRSVNSNNNHNNNNDKDKDSWENRNATKIRKQYKRILKKYNFFANDEKKMNINDNNNNEPARKKKKSSKKTALTMEEDIHNNDNDNNDNDNNEETAMNNKTNPAEDAELRRLIESVMEENNVLKEEYRNLKKNQKNKEKEKENKENNNNYDLDDENEMEYSEKEMLKSVRQTLAENRRNEKNRKKLLNFSKKYGTSYIKPSRTDGQKFLSTSWMGKKKKAPKKTKKAEKNMMINLMGALSESQSFYLNPKSRKNKNNKKRRGSVSKKTNTKKIVKTTKTAPKSKINNNHNKSVSTKKKMKKTVSSKVNNNNNNKKKKKNSSTNKPKIAKGKPLLYKKLKKEPENFFEEILSKNIMKKMK